MGKKKRPAKSAAHATKVEALKPSPPADAPNSYAWPLLFCLFAVFFLRFILQFDDIEKLGSMDLPSFYSASVLVFRDGVSPYSYSTLAAVLSSDVSKTYPYLYPPPSLFVFYPLSLVTFAQAKILVFTVNVSLVAMLAFLMPLKLCRLEPRRHLGLICLCMGVFVLFGPVAQTVDHGQINLWVLSFLVLFWIRSRSGHSLSAAFFLTLAVVLKTYPAMLLPMLWFSGRRRDALLCVSFLLVLGLLSWLALPQGLWEDWLFRIAPSGAYTKAPEGLFAPSTIGNQSINGFFSRLYTVGEWAKPIEINPERGAMLATLSAGVLITLSIFAAFLTRRTPNSLDRAMIVTLPCMFLIAPFSWFHHLVYMLPTLLMLLCASWRGSTLGSLFFLGLTLLLTLTMAFGRMLDSELGAACALWTLAVFSVLSPRVALPGDELDALGRAA